MGWNGGKFIPLSATFKYECFPKSIKKWGKSSEKFTTSRLGKNPNCIILVR